MMSLYHIPEDNHIPKRIFTSDKHGCVVWFAEGNPSRSYCYGNVKYFPDDCELWFDQPHESCDT